MVNLSMVVFLTQQEAPCVNLGQPTMRQTNGSREHASIEPFRFAED